MAAHPLEGFAAVAVQFGGKLLEWALLDFGQGTPRVLVVLNPTAHKQTLRALDMRAIADRDQFFNFQHGDGRLKDEPFSVEKGLSQPV
jgi:hypothetical protein